MYTDRIHFPIPQMGDILKKIVPAGPRKRLLTHVKDSFEIGISIKHSHFSNKHTHLMDKINASGKLSAMKFDYYY